MELTTTLLLTRRTLLRALLMALLVAMLGAFALHAVGSRSLFAVLPAVLGALLGGLAPSVSWRRKLER